MLLRVQNRRPSTCSATARRSGLQFKIVRHLPCPQRSWHHAQPMLLLQRGPMPCSAVDASDPAGLQAAIESKLAESLDPDRLSISVESPSSIRIEVAANTFDGLKVTERISLVKELLGAEVDADMADAAEVVAMTPREYFASLKKWC